MTAGAIATILGVLLLVVAVLGPWLAGVASRLDRLHIRTDAAWAGLDSALARRAVVARALAAAGCLAPADAATLRATADRAEMADPEEREAAENELTRLLGELDHDIPLPGLLAELVEAQQRLVLARRVYNDAVRDTRALRRGRLVRWLRLAGTAAEPEFFEIAEPESAPLRWRRSVRLVVVDDADRVLLFHGADPARHAEPFWFTPGGGVRGDESPHATAMRELNEETGLCAREDDLTGPVWVHRSAFSFNGTVHDGQEWFFLLRVDRRELDTAISTHLAARTIDGYRWWSAAELTATDETVFPERFAEMLPDLLAADWDGHTRHIR